MLMVFKEEAENGSGMRADPLVWVGVKKPFE